MCWLCNDIVDPKKLPVFLVLLREEINGVKELGSCQQAQPGWLTSVLPLELINFGK